MVCCWVCQMNEPFNVPCAWSTNLKVYDHIHPTYAFPGKDSVSVSLYAIEIYWIHSKPLRSGICFFLPPYSLKLIEKDLDFTPFFICASHSQDFNGMAPHTGAELFRKAHQVATGCNGRTDDAVRWSFLGKRGILKRGVFHTFQLRSPAEYQNLADYNEYPGDFKYPGEKYISWWFQNLADVEWCWMCRSLIHGQGQLPHPGHWCCSSQEWHAQWQHGAALGMGTNCQWCPVLQSLRRLFFIVFRFNEALILSYFIDYIYIYIFHFGRSYQTSSDFGRSHQTSPSYHQTQLMFLLGTGWTRARQVLLSALNLDASQKEALAEYNHNQQMIETFASKFHQKTLQDAPTYPKNIGKWMLNMLNIVKYT